MLSAKKIMLIGIAFAFCERSFAQTDNSESFIDGDKVPYNFLRLDLGLTYDHFREYKLENGGVTRTNKTGIGVGLETHLPLIYALTEQNEHRFRIADDIGLGTYLTSNSYHVFDDLKDSEMVGQNSEPKINGAIILMAGIQAAYRINQTFDIGVVYYPLFMHYDFADAGAFGQTFGGSFRAGKLYGNFRFSPMKKGHENMPVNKGVKTLSLRYIISSPDSDKTPRYLFITCTSFKYQNLLFSDPTQSPTQYQDYTPKNSNWTVVQVGWAIGI